MNSVLAGCRRLLSPITVKVDNKGVEFAYRRFKRSLKDDKMRMDVRSRQHFEKPYDKKRRQESDRLFRIELKQMRSMLRQIMAKKDRGF
eukprot:CAMPEP_0113882526 /NCGR_PEP_ID=MMETSP0780_2-20120614/9014_1 /TAXON_ID=652834 /ORGANISM="Palpitomonas bilix" /LENGTH=88 /DNA_ID=CAMNT_0000869571 /DNA_START=12 /DNA_END=278 /DNA_ORIENTATION=- /assembly_acc=CAM_ASM_000599